MSESISTSRCFKFSSMSNYCSPCSSPRQRKTPRRSSLPLDLLRDVLSRLPTISLIKLRPVCREWRDIIDDPHFAAMHATSGVESPRILLLPKPCHGADPRFTALSDELLVTSLPKWVVKARSHGVEASCHGLLCFEDLLQGGTYLLNPLTREIVLLSSVRPKRWHQLRIAVGVDRLTDRYKILRVSSHVGIDRNTCLMKTEVLDQGSRSWRDIASVPPCLLLGQPVFAAGSIHLSLGGARDHIISIWSFDLTKEEFNRTPCPEFESASVVDLRGVLGLVDCSRDESYDVWVREESGAWVKKYRIPMMLPWGANDHRLTFFLGCGGRKMVLMFLRSIMSYDPATDKLEYVQRGGAALDRSIAASP